jgi:glycerol-3-phosphate dehydrogenase
MDYFDVIVIGGGIHGAGMAQAAAAAGYSVCLLEQAPQLATGTSSRSSKLIHGGLRYLESGQFSLVRECLAERAILLNIAPDLVTLKPFHIPVYALTRRRPWQLRIGLGLYALLSGFARSGHYQRLPPSRWHELDGLETAGLQAVFRYYDAQTDDARLTAAVMDSAIELGAVLHLSTTVEHIQLGEPNLVTTVCDQQRQRLQARLVVNAAGPWVNRVIERVTPRQSHLPIEWVQGSHIEVPGRLAHGCYYLEAPQDRRAVFALPWHDHVMVGTTEVPFAGDPAIVRPSDSEQDYLLATLGLYFPAYARYTRADISNSFAGLRVLPSGNDRPFKRSRETLFLYDDDSKPRLVSIYGGKLTAYRATAERLMTRLARTLPRRTRQADTRDLRLSSPT